MEIVTGDRYLEKLVKFVEEQAGLLIEGTVVLKLNPAGLHYVQSRLEALHELESLLAGAPVDYLRAYVSDLGDHRALEQLRRILRLLTSLKVVSVLPSPLRDPTPLSLLPFGRLRILELRGCDLSTSAAKGLLELRHTLEKIICYNSTDALRHVFASRIVEIKDSLQWNRLSFVSCACNGLVLMDESLQLLPAVEVLDLSRNKFAKVDNLRKCAKLKHLDLGFNHLRSVTSFSEVSSHIIKLVLRNNALTTLNGIENLKSLEGLDVSYNIISNFSELEFLVGLPSLQSLWLEGNPLYGARWYRAHVFSLFSHPDKLKLDDKGISKREFWKRQIIVASRQKRPASFGFYSPAKDDAKEEGGPNRKKKKLSRLASIESEEESVYISDLETVSCDNETQSRQDTVISDSETEIGDLMNRIELMKKERSILWLQEFREWMDQAPANVVDGLTRATIQSAKDSYIRDGKTRRHLGESSRYVSDSVQASGDESSTNILESDNSFMDTSTISNANRFFDVSSSLGNTGGMQVRDVQDAYLNSFSHEGTSSSSIVVKSTHPLTLTYSQAHGMVTNVSNLLLNVIDDGAESHSSSIFPGSPPHFREDILHRRQNLVEEILQLSAESYSVASSDSGTSCGEEDICEVALCEGQSSLSNHEQGLLIPSTRDSDQGISDSSTYQPVSRQKLISSDLPPQLGECDISPGTQNYEISRCSSQETEWWGKTEIQKKPKRRIISLLGDNRVSKTEPSQESSWNLETAQGTDFIENCFNTNVADRSVQETCMQHICCACVLDGELMCTERDVVLLLSTKRKLYVLLFDVTEDKSGLNLLSTHNVEDVKEVLFGLGLQIVRVHIEAGPAYRFITRSIEKSRQLLCMLQVFDTSAPNNKCSLRSLEQVQVESFEKQLYGGSKVSIFQYSMVLLWSNKNDEKSWLPRSLFVVGGNILLCLEDLMQFGSLSNEASSPHYFGLDSYWSIAVISEMVIEGKETELVTSTLRKEENIASSSLELKLKWFSEVSLSNFVALVKAIHLETSASPLLVRFMS